jgi:hypothetical protein
VNSELTDEFLACFRRLPERIKRQARKNYKLWKANPKHRSIEFKLVGKKMPVYSVRVAIGWRPLGIKRKETLIWFWIGSHAEYDSLIKRV